MTFDDGRDLITGLANGEFTGSDFNTHYMELRGDNIVDKITGGTVAGKLFVGKWHLDDLHFGVSRTERTKSRDLINNTLNGGADYYSGDNAINVGDLGDGVISSTLNFPHFMDGVGSSFPRSFLGFDVPNYLARLAGYDGNLRADGSPYDFSMAAPAWNPLQSYRVSEETNAFYVQADFSGERWNGDVGVRLVKTSTRAQAWDAEILSITENGAFNYTADYADPTPILQDSDYTFALPSANFIWRFTDECNALGARPRMACPRVTRARKTPPKACRGRVHPSQGGNANSSRTCARQGTVPRGSSSEQYIIKIAASPSASERSPPAGNRAGNRRGRHRADEIQSHRADPVQRDAPDQRRLRQGAWPGVRVAALLGQRLRRARAVHPQLVQQLGSR